MTTIRMFASSLIVIVAAAAATIIAWWCHAPLWVRYGIVGAGFCPALLLPFLTELRHGPLRVSDYVTVAVLAAVGFGVVAAAGLR